MEEGKSDVKLLCFVGPILEAPEVIGVVMGALELVDVVAGFGVQSRTIVIVISWDYTNDVWVIGHHHTYIMCRDAPSSVEGNKTGYVVQTVIEVKAQWWGCFSAG